MFNIILLFYRQIAERRQSYQHYEREAGAYTQAIASKQVRQEEFVLFVIVVP